MTEIVKQQPEAFRRSVVKLGLSQLQVDDLNRVRKHLQDGGKLLLNGLVYDFEKACGCPMFVGMSPDAQKRARRAVQVTLPDCLVEYYGSDFDTNPALEVESDLEVPEVYNGELTFADALKGSNENEISEIVDELLKEKTT